MEFNLKYTKVLGKSYWESNNLFWNFKRFLSDSFNWTILIAKSSWKFNLWSS